MPSKPRAEPGPGRAEPCLSECEYLFILGRQNAHVTPLVAVRDGRPREIAPAALCWLLKRHTARKLWQLGQQRRALNTREIDFYDVSQNCSAVGSRTTKRDEVVVSTRGLARSEPPARAPAAEIKQRMIEAALQQLRSHPEAVKAMRPTRSTPDRASIFDDTPVRPRWHLEARGFRHRGRLYLLVQGRLRSHPVCGRAPKPDACRETLRTNPAADLRLSGVLLLSRPLGAINKAPTAPRVELFKLGSDEDETGQVELIDVLRVQGASSPWIVLKSTTDLQASWSYLVAHLSGAGWKLLAGGAESTL